MVVHYEIDTGPQNTMEHYEAVRRAKAAEGRVRELEDFLLGLGYDPKKVGIPKLTALGCQKGENDDS